MKESFIIFTGRNNDNDFWQKCHTNIINNIETKNAFKDHAKHIARMGVEQYYEMLDNKARSEIT